MVMLYMASKTPGPHMKYADTANGNKKRSAYMKFGDRDVRAIGSAKVVNYFLSKWDFFNLPFVAAGFMARFMIESRLVKNAKPV